MEIYVLGINLNFSINMIMLYFSINIAKAGEKEICVVSKNTNLQLKQKILVRLFLYLICYFEKLNQWVSLYIMPINELELNETHLWGRQH